ncbi:hypothetical protein ACLB2K_051822 [Fragaria x ananassa]
MAHNRRNGGGYRMEGRDNNADMEEIKRMINQLAARVVRIETRSQDSDGRSFDGERDVNPFRNDGGNSRRGFDMKVDISEFEGRMRPDDFVDWLNTVERVFEYKKIPDEKRVKIVAIKLVKHASAWWEQLQVRKERLGKPKIKTWEKMRKELRKKFIPENYLQNNFLKLHNIRQGSRSVDEFTEEFDLLTMRCGLAEEEEQTVAIYLAGLIREIHDIVVLQPCWSYSEVYQLAIQVEK